MLIVMAGLPATGKSTLARLLARRLGAAHVRIDTVEATLQNMGLTVGHAGYGVAFGIARDNLELGLRVVADSVNPVEETRRLWRGVAEAAGVPYQDVEILCSDAAEHRARVEARRATYLATPEGRTSHWHPPSWDDVTKRHTDPWTTDRIVLDTAGQRVEESFEQLCAALGLAK